MDAKEFIEKEGLQHTLAEYDEGGYLGIDFGKLEQALNDFVKLNLPVVVRQSEQLFCGVKGGYCPMEIKKDGKCTAEFKCENQVTK